MGSTLELSALTVRLGGRPVLNGLSMRLPGGESTALLGASGSGKTTALRAAAGFLQPERGRVLVDGNDITGLPPERRGMAMIHQRFLLFPHLKVADNVAFGLQYAGVRSSERTGIVSRLLRLVDLEGLQERYPHQLSGGQQQRVAIARALAVGPRVLLLDEPLNNLDSTIRDHLLDQLRSLQRSSGMTMLYVTHDQTEAARIAHRVALLDGGSILQEGDFDDLLDRPVSAEVVELLGLRNLLPTKVSGDRVEIPCLGMVLRRPVPPASRLLAYLPSDRVRLCASGSGSIEFSGVVKEIVREPLITRFTVRCIGAEIQVVRPREVMSAASISVGSDVVLSIAPADLQLLPGRTALAT